MDTNFIQAVLLIVVVIVACAAVVYLVKLWEAKQVQVVQGKWTLFKWIISQAVVAAEQLWRGNFIQKDERIKRAAEIAQRELNAWGVRGIDVKRILDACESAVGFDLNQAKLIAASVPPPALPDIPIGPQN